MIDSTTTKQILNSLGVNGGISETLANLGLKGIFWGVLFFVVKFLFQKFLWAKITNWIAELTKDKGEHTEALKESNKVLTDIRELLTTQSVLLNQSIEENRTSFVHVRDNLTECQEDLNKQTSDIGLILEDSSGELDKTLCVNMVKNYLGRLNGRIESFFRHRVEKNHIKGNEELILNKYNSFVNRTSPKIEAQFSMYTHKGNNLFEFLGYGGATSYLKMVMTDLFELQRATMLGNHNNLIDLREIDSHLEYLTGYMVGAITKYCDKGEILNEYISKNPIPKTTVITQYEIDEINELIFEEQRKRTSE